MKSENTPTIIVRNLLTDVEMTFTGLAPQEALISAYMVESNLSSQLLDPKRRAELAEKITHGQASMGLGDWAVMLDTEQARPTRPRH